MPKVYPELKNGLKGNFKEGVSEANRLLNKQEVGYVTALGNPEPLRCVLKKRLRRVIKGATPLGVCEPKILSAIIRSIGLFLGERSDPST